jgi:transcriptional regulator with XRE-family HTH domain
MLRVARGLSQGKVAKKLGITFQQVQKYENGANRISVSKLYEIAGVLGVAVAQLFADAADADKLSFSNTDVPSRVDLLVAHALAKLPHGALKDQITGLIFILAEKTPPSVTRLIADAHESGCKPRIEGGRA